MPQYLIKCLDPKCGHETDKFFLDGEDIVCEECGSKMIEFLPVVLSAPIMR